MAVARETVLYAEKYRKGGAVIKQDNLPVLRHTTPGFDVERAEIMEVGRVETPDGVRQEYQILKVYFKPS